MFQLSTPANQSSWTKNSPYTVSTGNGRRISIATTARESRVDARPQPALDREYERRFIAKVGRKACERHDNQRQYG